MASSSGISSSAGSGSSSLILQNSGSEHDLQQLMIQRKRKRMTSNRESAKRSRMRKQKHLDDLITQLENLKNENNQIITTFNITSHHYLTIEAQNSILRAQIDELSHRLQSLNEIINFIDPNHDHGYLTTDNQDSNLWNYPYVNQQPIMASADMLQY